MSFILDALKKSETDRQRQNGPALFEVKVAPPRNGLPVWAVGLGALLAVNLVIVAWVLLRRPAQAETGANQGQSFQASDGRGSAGGGPGTGGSGTGGAWQGGQGQSGAWQGSQAGGGGPGGQPGQGGWQGAAGQGGGQGAWQGAPGGAGQGGSGGWQGSTGTGGQGQGGWQGSAAAGQGGGPGQAGQGGGQAWQGAQGSGSGGGQNGWQGSAGTGGPGGGQGAWQGAPGGAGQGGGQAWQGGTGQAGQGGGQGWQGGQQGQPGWGGQTSGQYATANGAAPTGPLGQPAGPTAPGSFNGAGETGGDKLSADDYAPAADAPAAAPFGNRVSRGTSSGVPLYQDAALKPGVHMPELRLDLHVFAAQPQERFVMINMHKLHEGDTLPEGVRVESITPEGAVLSKDGSRFLLPRQ